MIVSYIVFCMILFSGSFLGATLWKKRFEDILPLTISIMIMILFLFGIIGCLEVGVYVICTISIIIYMYSIIFCVYKRKIKHLLNYFFTSSFWIYIFVIMFFMRVVYGKLLHSWDEFSHWGDIVKAMVYVNDFGTNSLSNSLFKTYPPGMSLFQYFIQRIHFYITGEMFCEWKLYIGYSMFMIAFIIPFFKKVTLKKKKDILINAVVVLGVILAPMIFYKEIYTSLYIDPFLGVLASVGYLTIILNKSRDMLKTFFIWSVCSMLVLAKDAGLVFAIFIGILYIIDLFIIEKGNYIRNLVISSLTLCSIILPKIMWGYHINKKNIGKSFSNRINIKQLILIISGRDNSYKSDVWKNYGKQLIINKIKIGNSNVDINYVILFLILGYLLHRLIKTNIDINEKRKKVIIITICVNSVVYIIGLCITYMFKFSEYEALYYASFQRYISIIAVMLMMIVVFLIVQIIYDKFNKYLFVFICCLLAIAPLEYFYDMSTGKVMKDSIKVRNTYNSIELEMKKHTHIEDRIYIVSQRSSGFDYYVLKSSMRPFSIVSKPWSVGEKALYDGDVWTCQITAEDWMKTLCNDADYLALYKIDEQFIKTYGVLFDDSSNIVSNSIYKINKQRKKLEKCEEKNIDIKNRVDLLYKKFY